MKIGRRLQVNRTILIMLIILFYGITFLCIRQLNYLNSSRDLEPLSRSHHLYQQLEIANSAYDRKATSHASMIAIDRFNHGTRLGSVVKNVTNVESIVKNVTEGEPVVKRTLEYIDWNDYELMAKDAQRSGIGEHGAAFDKPLSQSEQQLSEQLFQLYKFNAFASDHISLQRSIRDSRTDVCKRKKYLKDIPDAFVSIIMIFHNEKNSTLLRALHSIVNRSPARLIKEIVLVDDFSSSEELKAPLEAYIGLHFPQVKLIRNSQRHGLIRSRMIGSNSSSGDILLFLDAHVEVNYNYLPPLLEPIILNYKTIVCPEIDQLLYKTLEIRRILYGSRGAFSWDMVFRYLPRAEENSTLPRLIPVMLGAAFAISRRWWEEIGKYDPGLEIWGGEQYEISFKSWLCGGRVVDVPCSRVAHLFRQLPYLEEISKTNLVERNFLRVAKVWMDEYIEYVFQRRPIMRTLKSGNLTAQFAIRKRLKCKSFKWYLTEVVPDLIKYFPLIEPPVKAWGQLKSEYNQTLCVFPTESGWLHLDDCDKSPGVYYRYDWRQHIRFSQDCFTNLDSLDVFVSECRLSETRPVQQFVWDFRSGHIVSLLSKHCLDINTQTHNIVMAPCNPLRATQKWKFDYFNSTLIDEALERFRVDLAK